MNCDVYIITNESHRTLYVGMSTDLPARIYSHREGLVDGFANRYRCKKLVYYEGCDDPDQAYLREKQLKGWTRVKKLGLINQFNPKWTDLYDHLITDCI
ncbi:MAG: GIY-YIG nuclease family protein [Patescibacteria group bacterium]|jgi:putative endonuclease